MMKGTKKYPKVKVLEHGKEYISPDFAPICPECGSENCRLAWDCGLKTKGSWDYTGVIYSTRVYFQEYVCRDCECRFRVDEGRKIEVNRLAIIAILVSVLGIASIIVAIVIGAIHGGS